MINDMSKETAIKTLVHGIVAPLVISLLWNWQIVPLAHVPEIGYWQAFWIRTLILALVWPSLNEVRIVK